MDRKYLTESVSRIVDGTTRGVPRGSLLGPRVYLKVQDLRLLYN